MGVYNLQGGKQSLLFSKAMMQSYDTSLLSQQ